MFEAHIRVFSRFAQTAKITVRMSSMAATKAKPMNGVPCETGVHQFQEIPKNPFNLFKKWHQDHTLQNPNNHIAANAFCLSTASKDGRVSSRNVIMRRLDDDGFLIMTDNRSKKSKELAENPYAAMSFLWVTNDEDGRILSRQVRIEGDVKSLEYPLWEEIYEREPLFCKIRAYVCHQGKKVTWDELKEHHDELLREFENGSHDLHKPDHVVAYKLFPTMFEFYESEGPVIADRVMYLKEEGEWENSRIAA